MSLLPPPPPAPAAVQQSRPAFRKGRRSWHGVAPRARVEDRTDARGWVFDSRGEMVWYLGLELEQRAGVIRDLKCQVRYRLCLPLPDGIPILIYSPGFPNGRVAEYTIDAEFDRLELAGPGKGMWRHIWAEYKGHDDMPGDKLRRAVFEACILRNQDRVTVYGPAAKKAQRKAVKIAAGRAARRRA